jgi:hypothetical protein
MHDAIILLYFTNKGQHFAESYKFGVHEINDRDLKSNLTSIKICHLILFLWCCNNEFALNLFFSEWIFNLPYYLLFQLTRDIIITTLWTGKSPHHQTESILDIWTRIQFRSKRAPKVSHLTCSPKQHLNKVIKQVHFGDSYMVVSHFSCLRGG